MPSLLKPGVYETIYGNACEVMNPRGKSAWDIDSAEKIPMSMVDLTKFIRELD